MILACLLAAFALSLQDPPQDATIPERLDALIAKTNASEGFVVRYQLHGSDGREFALRIAYRSPTELAIDFKGETSRFFNRMRPNDMDSVTVEDGRASKASIRDWNSSALWVEQLRGFIEKELKVVLRPEDLSAHDCPILELSVAADDSSVNFAFGLGTSSDSRFGWLQRARHRPERVSVGGADGKDLVLAYSEKASVFISTESGFVTRLEKWTESGFRCGLELVSLETESRPADSEFELPECGYGTRDASERLAEQTQGQALYFSREDLFRTIARSLDDGRLHWDDESAAKIERVMRALHAVDFAPTCTRLLLKSQATIEAGSDRLREALRTLDLHDPEVVAGQKGQMELGRQTFEGQLSSLLEREVMNGMPRGKCKARPSLYEELGAMERRVLSEIFAAKVTKPALAEFDEKLGEQLAAK